MNAVDAKLQAQQTWGDSPTGIGTQEGLEPGTPEHFERSLKWRSEVEQNWLQEVAPSHEWSGKRVLEVGFGPGYDALAIIQAGADYSGVDITPENVERTRKALGFYGLSGDLRQGDAEALPFPDASFDVVYSNGVLHHCPDISATFAEAARVLKTGGRFYVVVYHRDSVSYWLAIFLYRWILRLGFTKRSLAQQLSTIEWNTVGAEPLVTVYSRAKVRRLLADAGLSVSTLRVRKLLSTDFPLGRFVPSPILAWMGRTFGWYVCAEAFKP